MRARLALVLLLASLAVRGEENCGRLERFATFVPAPPGVADLHVVWIRCDGTFRRFEEVLPAARTPEDPSRRWLRVGRVYRATAVGRDLVPAPPIPHHHAAALYWTNEDELPDDLTQRTIVFAVDSQEIWYRGGMSWTNRITATILSVEEPQP